MDEDRALAAHLDDEHKTKRKKVKEVQQLQAQLLGEEAVEHLGDGVVEAQDESERVMLRSLKEVVVQLSDNYSKPLPPREVVGLVRRAT
jgi:hypothetical protein